MSHVGKSNRTIIISLIGFIVCFIVSTIVAFIASDSYALMFLIPIFYGVFNFFPGQFLRYFTMSPGIIYFTLVCFIRYLLTPLFTALSGNYTLMTGRYTTDKYFNLATILLIYEMIVVYLTAFHVLKNHNIKLDKEKEVNVHKKSQFILFLFVSLAILLVLLKPSLLSEYNFVFSISANESVGVDISAESGFLSMVVSAGLRILPLIFIYYGKIRLDKKQRFRYILVAMIPSLVISMYAQGMRRGALLTPFTLIILILISIFPKYKNKIFFSMGSCMVAILLFMTFQKSIVRTSTEFLLLSDQINWLAAYLGGYFSFIKHTAVAIDTSYIFENVLGIRTLLNDIFYPLPYIGKILFNGNLRSAIYFNYTYYNSTLITDSVIPTIGQGVIYLGFFLSPFISALFVKASLSADKKYRASTDIFAKYLWGYTAWTLASSIDANINLLTKTLFQVILPMALVYLVYKYALFKSKNNV